MEANERIVLRFEGRPVCSIKLHLFGLFEERMNYPAPKTLFSEYGPGSNTKLIKIDHRASKISGGMQGICRGWRSRKSSGVVGDAWDCATSRGSTADRVMNPDTTHI